jgi:hypothetical protein
MKKSIKNYLYDFGITTGIAATVLFNAGCTNNANNNTSTSKKRSSYEIVRLGVTDNVVLGAFLENNTLHYNGMPNEKVFSLSTVSHNSVNNYYPDTSKTVLYYNRELAILKVTPDSLVFSYEK